MAYVSLYRKWRPQTFADVIGQAHVVRTLSNALTEKRIAHAYLFTGPRGTGKTTIARLLAKGLNCVAGPTADPCGECASCRRIAEGMAMDVVEIDGASNRGIDEMRDVRERVRFAPTEGAYKIYIIDEVHMLTTEAFNALLKVLEEPPGHVVFVFATTEPHKIPATVASRCQRFDFRRLAASDAIARLKAVAKAEGIDATDDAFTLIARYADGSLRDGLGILDQSRAYADKVTAAVVADVLGVAPLAYVQRFADALAEADAAKGLALVKELQEAGRDLRQFLKDAARYLRDVLLLRATGERKVVDDLGEEDGQILKRHAEQLAPQLLLRAIEVLGAADGDMRWAAQSSLPVEMAVIRLTEGRGVESSSGARSAESSSEGRSDEPVTRAAVHSREPVEPSARTGAADAARTPSMDTAALLQRIERLEALVARLSGGDLRRDGRGEGRDFDHGENRNYDRDEMRDYGRAATRRHAEIRGETRGQVRGDTRGETRGDLRGDGPGKARDFDEGDTRDSGRVDERKERRISRGDANPVARSPEWEQAQPSAAASAAPSAAASAAPPAATSAAPSAAASAAPSAVSDTGSDDKLAAVLSQWDTLLDTLRERRQIHIQAFLREGKPIDVRSGVVTIEFPQDRGFHRASLDTDAHRPIVESILSELVGFDIKITTVLAGESRDSATSAGPVSGGRDRGGGESGNAGRSGMVDAPKADKVAGTGTAESVHDDAPDDPSRHPVVQEALRMFGGKIVSVKRNDGKGVDA